MGRVANGSPPGFPVRLLRARLVRPCLPQSFVPDMIFVEGGSGVPGRDQDAIQPGQTRTVDVRIFTSCTDHQASESASVQIMVTDQLGNEYRRPRLALLSTVPA